MLRKPGRNRRVDGHRRYNEKNRRKYFTARWSRLRLAVLTRDKGLCQECARNGWTNPGNQVDHIVMAEERPDLFWNADNLQTLCQKCHSRKTVAETYGRDKAGPSP